MSETKEANRVLQLMKNAGLDNAEAAKEALTACRQLRVSKNLLKAVALGREIKVLEKQAASDDVKKMAKSIRREWKKQLDGEDNNGKGVQKAEEREKEEEKKTEEVKEDRQEEKAEKEKEGEDKKEQVANHALPLDPAVAAAEFTMESPKVNKERVPPVQDEGRKKCIGALAKVLRTAGETMKEDAQEAAARLEYAVHKLHEKDKNAYKTQIRVLVGNLSKPHNMSLCESIVTGRVVTSSVAEMTPDDLASDKRKAELEEMRKASQAKWQVNQTAGLAVTDQFKCGKCGQRKTTYFQMQTRSADEPMTTFVTCIVCNNKWKFC